MAMISQSRLTAQEARDFSSIKKEAFDSALEAVRQMCDMCIRDASRRGKESCEFSIPRGIMGRETYNQHVMGKMLAQQLYEDDFDVTGTTDKLTISWGCEERPPPAPKKQPTATTTTTIKPAAPTRTPFTALISLPDPSTSSKKKKVEKRVNVQSY